MAKINANGLDITKKFVIKKEKKLSNLWHSYLIDWVGSKSEYQHRTLVEARDRGEVLQKIRKTYRQEGRPIVNFITRARV